MATRSRQGRQAAGTTREKRWAGLKQDSLGLGLIATTVLLAAAMTLWLSNVYPTLPDLLPLHFDASGNPDRIADRSEIFVLPMISIMVTLLNVAAGLLLRLRFGMVFASYLLWGGAFMVQLLLWIGLWNLTH